MGKMEVTAKMKNTIKSRMTLADQKKLAIKVIAKQIISHFDTYRNDVLFKKELFRVCFGKRMTESNEDWFKWQYVLKALTFLRKNTQCFVVCHRGAYSLIDENSGTEYIRRLDAIKKGCNKMKKRAFKAINDDWINNYWYADLEKFE